MEYIYKVILTMIGALMIFFSGMKFEETKKFRWYLFSGIGYSLIVIARGL